MPPQKKTSDPEEALSPSATAEGGAKADPLAVENAFTAKLARLESVSPTPFAKVQEYQHTPHWRIHARHAFLRSIHDSKPETILDFGCGNGQLSCRLGLMGYRVTGVDLSPEMTDLARERAAIDGVADHVNILTGDLLTMEPQGQFDVICAALILHHLELRPALEALLRWLKPSGMAVFWEPVAFSPALQWIRDHSGVEKDISPNERQLDREELSLISSYFEKTDIRYFHLTSRLARVIPFGGSRELGPPHRMLCQLDRSLLRTLPCLEHLAGSAVLRCYKNGD